jgi:hypothetical protein
MAVIAAAVADLLLALEREHATRWTALGSAILAEYCADQHNILFKCYVWVLHWTLSLRCGTGSRPESERAISCCEYQRNTSTAETSACQSKQQTMWRSTVPGCAGLYTVSCALPLCSIHSSTFTAAAAAAAAAAASFNATLPITSATAYHLVWFTNWRAWFHACSI